MCKAKWIVFTVVLAYICGASIMAQGVATNSSEQSTDEVYKASEVTRKVMIRSKPEPVYTDEARENKIEGTVRLRLVLHSTGEVTEIKILKSLPHGLTEKAMEAARKIEFTPAEKDGRPVSQYVIIEYNFSL